MDLEEAKAEYERMSDKKFALRFGAICGVGVTTCFLSLSFIRPYLDLFFSLLPYPLLALAIYCYAVANKFKRISKIVHGSEEKTT